MVSALPPAPHVPPLGGRLTTKLCGVASINRPAVIQRVALVRHAVSAPTSGPPPSLRLTPDEAQATVHFRLRTIEGLGAQLLGCFYHPNLFQPSVPGRGSVQLTYLLGGRHISVVEHMDDDPDGPLVLVVKPHARWWSTEIILGSEYVVLRTEDGTRYSSVNWKTQDGVVMGVEPVEMAAGIDEALLARILENLQ